MHKSAGWQLIFSCEHGGNQVPPEYADLFDAAEEVLSTHRGYDLGIASFARRLAGAFGVSLTMAEVTRLLVELNRSPGHPGLFSEFSRDLPARERRQLLERYYFPFRQEVTERIKGIVAAGGAVCHISLHSFTPELKGEVRQTDIGLLYDPRRALERRFCSLWQNLLAEKQERFRIRRNYPYRGTADAFVTALRRCFPATVYLGLELEVNQKWPLQGGEVWSELQERLQQSLSSLWAMWPEQANKQ
ncbi:N-formylglutamate amidohydrolase [Desulfobulbus alkaliphilus]|uniref:N-formylglutamate amidohydrolase n=1 Tax=Desulfobulbus alkaliphilus TaxID=869814 RepID=UPI001965E3BE|nr:N-formylglutamate amidohydrolase [Desulfobulbus alkaliphilus]MBM9537552.1 N-formylglutamate amidohydrolase [Desulfobulbus alkaliphilus]